MSEVLLTSPGKSDSRAPSWPFLLLGPAVLVNLIGFVWPLFLLATISFKTGGSGGSIADDLTLANWLGVLSDPFYLRLLLSTVTLSLVTTACTLACSFPLALFIYRSHPRWRNLLVVICVSPLLISAVVRTYGWIVILGDSGFIASTVRAVGLEPFPLIFNRAGLVIGMVEILMPYMILSLMAGFGRLDSSLEEAAASLGANRLTVLRLIVIPLTLPGILLGCFLVFVITVSAFITPKVLAGGRVPLLATEIYDQAILTLNWPVASVLSYIALIIFGLATLLYMKMLRHLE
ncbi:ABC transporter permease subunit [Rhizobium leguminosarum bv. viciae]|uniref:ABC transporter permease n=1 Tax=Rhizobium leguminosarum TaxID=384 RepID=UPI00143F6054|nr:ABC transporter permease [Rhizobium leguminosarum]NKM65694.1 ABC transporter permease subunit [Rhizobium leguminosarum bv. viciae]